MGEQALSASSWEADLRARSAKAVGMGGKPLVRMGVSPVPNAARVRVVWLEGGHLSSAIADSTATAVATASAPTARVTTADLLSEGVIVFVDEEALKISAKLLRDNGQTLASRAVVYLSRQGYTNKFVCLTRALSTRWWSPFPGTGTFWQWAGAMGLHGKDVPACAHALYTMIAKGDEAPPAVQRAAANLSKNALLPYVSAQYRAYDAARSLFEEWGSVCRQEPGLLGKYLASGEVVRCQLPHRLNGGMLACPVSTPGKLRRGNVRLFNHSGLGIVVDLVGFSIGDNDEIIAVLHTGPRKGKDLDRLVESWQDGDEWLLTSAPMSGMPASERALWLLRKGAAPEISIEHPIQRDVPVDVILAGS